jgi:PAS domain S-box-containing protein
MDENGKTKTGPTDGQVRPQRKSAVERPPASRDGREDGAGQVSGEHTIKLAALVEQPMAGVYLAREGLFTYANSEMADIFGYASEEMAGVMGPADLACAEDRALVAEGLERLLSGRADSVQHEFRGVRKDGQTVYAEVFCRKVSDEGAEAVLGIVLDRSDQKRLGEQLVRAERIKAIGALAGGIAHDFNNLLMAIQGHTSLILHSLKPDDPTFAKLKIIEEIVKSGSELTRKLLTFASGAKYEIAPCDLNAVIRKGSEMFGRARKEIAVKSRLREDLCTVDADGGQIEQMLLNLCLNAWQAMPGGGTLFLTTENVVLDRKFVRPYGTKAGRYAKLSVADTGKGMDERTKERIFEPFFTTRKAEKGTGLGLASVYNIVKEHAGIITVASEEGGGTTFDVYLPASKKAADKPTPPVPECRHVEKGAETVLLVDDEEAVIGVSRDMLEVLGYSVIVARSGLEAIEIFEREHAAIDLVILDVVMPDMGGEETLRRLLAIDPAAAVAVSSGYSLEGRVTRMMEQGCRAFIQKPFTINVLSQKLREALEKR